MRLIDADALKEHFKEYTLHSDIQVSLDRYALKVIEEEPIVDAAPVIRCKDCPHSMSFTEQAKKLVRLCTHFNMSVPNDWYCADAERKEE